MEPASAASLEPVLREALDAEVPAPRVAAACCMHQLSGAGAEGSSRMFSPAELLSAGERNRNDPATFCNDTMRILTSYCHGHISRKEQLLLVSGDPACRYYMVCILWRGFSIQVQGLTHHTGRLGRRLWGALLEQSLEPELQRTKPVQGSTVHRRKVCWPHARPELHGRSGMINR